MRYKRQLRTATTIRWLIEEMQPYVPISNKLFDALYEQESILYSPIKNGTFFQEKETVFTDIDLIIYVFLTFLHRAAVTLYLEEIAGYLKCSKKQLSNSIGKMRGIKVDLNNSYSYGRRILHEVRNYLITEKNEAIYIEEERQKKGKYRRGKVWYTNLEIDHKESGDEMKPANFFFVTIDDFDLLTDGKLTRKEFIFYLFLLRTDTNNKHRFYLKNTTIARRLKIKGVDTTLASYIEKAEKLGIIQINYPENYEKKVMAGREPSREFIPLFNRSRLSLYQSKDDEGKTDSQKEEVSSELYKLDFWME